MRSLDTRLDQYGTLLATPVASGVRFGVLDSWRGICALLVALFHFPASGPLAQNEFIASAYLFVDFFFVLSGFVITSNYAMRLALRKDTERFVLLRLGRVYPLHAVMLAAFVLFECVRLFLPDLGGGQAPFTGSFDLPGLLNNLALLQGVGFEDELTWNAPSWTISAEFFTYIIFAGVVLCLGGRSWLAFSMLALAAPVFLFAAGVPNMDLSYQFGLVRCLFGFSLGALIAWFQHDGIVAERAKPIAAGDRLCWTAAEVAMIGAIFLFVRGGGHTQASIAAPFVFALALYTFAHEGGAVSRLLYNRVFLLLGTLSYSIYMVHLFVQVRFYNIAALLDRQLGLGMTGEVSHHGLPAAGFGPGGVVFGTAVTLAMLALVVIVSWFTWRFIEVPGQVLFRRWADRI